MFEKLEELAKNNKKISDFHIRSGSPLAYRQTGEIIMVKDVMVKPQDLIDLMTTNCNEHETKKFQDTHELDSAVNISGLRFRANFYKTLNGPAAVLRRVESKIPEMGQFDLPDALYDIIDMHKGLVLVTGPTGSGKTTTLYSGLKNISDRSQNILTIEDPVEYALNGIGQTQVNSKTGLTFAKGLRAILRQDPDVVMVGEIRDKETADIAIQASLTGHLVLSTVHTNSAVNAITRLRDSQLGDERVKDISNYIKKGKLWEAFTSDKQVVLLIDEIDKADIEFPNDLLQELDRMEFFCYETGETIKAKHRPLIIMTSNNEKELPDAFLRRCFFHYIQFPDRETMNQIVNVHYPKIKKKLVKEALEIFFDLRKIPGLKKKPSTSELIDWLKLLLSDDMPDEILKNADSSKAIPPLYGALLKNEQDVQLLERLAFMSRREANSK